MGMLFRTADTQDVINALNSAFTSDGLARLRKGLAGPPGKSDKALRKIKDWLDPATSVNNKSALALVCNALGIWPRTTMRGKGRWMTFLKEFNDQDPGARESAEHLKVRRQLFQWIYGTGSTIQSIYFEATEAATPGSKKIVTPETLPTFGRLLMTTPVFPADELGDEDEGTP